MKKERERKKQRKRERKEGRKGQREGGRKERRKGGKERGKGRGRDKKERKFYMGWDLAQVVKCLPRQMDALSSNPSTTKTNQMK
jgi:hypothetical protein